MKHSIEITKEAALLLIGNDEKTWRNYSKYTCCEKTTYLSNGMIIAVIYNYISEVTQYYMQDINA